MKPILETKRLYLKPFTDNDFELLYKIRSSAEVMKYISSGVRTSEQVNQELSEEIAHQQKYGYSKWACFDKVSNEFVGRAGFSMMDNGQVEVGYGFLPEYWGKGYATESLNALLKWGLANIDSPEIIAFTSSENLASKRVIEKCGMKL